MDNIYACIDLKSFYASVECVERNLDPLNTNLVVADNSRTDKTVCLAITPTLKKYGLSGRSRLYEVKQKVTEINRNRYVKNNYKKFERKSYLNDELDANINFELDYIVAKPRMNLYMKYSRKIYGIYLKYVSKDDIYPYSIDEIFCDITHYLKMYKKTPEEVISMMIRDVFETTGITATAGIGTNLYLAKIAMDIEAKHMNPDKYGVRMAYLNEQLYKDNLWTHQPLTDFWRVGPGIAKKLKKYGMVNMGDVARMSINNEDLLYKLFGVNAELLIDHAWGYEPVTMKNIKEYKPKTNSLSNGQVLHNPYNFIDTRVVIKEMSEVLGLNLTSKNMVTNKVVLTIEYDVSNLENEEIYNKYSNEVSIDKYGRLVPRHSHGTISLNKYSSSTKLLMEKFLELYDRIVKPDLLIRKLNLAAIDIISKNSVKEIYENNQLDLFSNYEEIINKKNEEQKIDKEQEKLQETILNIKNKYGKNSILKGMNLLECATTKDRNEQIGGHRA